MNEFLTRNEQYIRGLWSIAKVLLFVLIIFVAVATIVQLREFSVIGRDVPAQSIITVTGDGEVFAVPDVAEFSFTVSEEQNTVEEAQTIVSEKIDAVIASLEDEFGIEKKDIKTTSYNWYPQYDWAQENCTQFRCEGGRQVLRGYQVTQTVRVKLENLEIASDVLAMMSTQEVTNVGGISFTIDDEDGLIREARQQAIEEAEEKAQKLADDLDVRLVRVVGFYENNNEYPVYFERAEAMGLGGGDMATPKPNLPTGENKITRQVQITYEIR